MVLPKPHIRVLLEYRSTIPVGKRLFSATTRPQVAPVLRLTDWGLDRFRKDAYNQNQPVALPFSKVTLPAACSKWFIHDGSSDHDLHQQPRTSELRTPFWSDYEATMVPLELTSTSPNGSTFHRSSVPLQVLLTYLGDPHSSSQAPPKQDHSFYLAQCELASLPEALQNDLPIPKIVSRAGKGDVYSSSLWMGRPPTYTPLHRDPNPNLFLQLAGRKVVRFFPPEIGSAIFDDIQERLSSQKQGGKSSASFRGEEMMQGPEKEMLHEVTWEDRTKDGLSAYALEAHLGLGEGLFIPKGWWHSVKGVGEGVTASVNWWFR